VFKTKDSPGSFIEIVLITVEWYHGYVHAGQKDYAFEDPPKQKDMCKK